jgi:hypothetical protein
MNIRTLTCISTYIHTHTHTQPEVVREDLSEAFTVFKDKCNATPMQYKSSKRLKKNKHQ